MSGVPARANEHDRLRLERVRPRDWRNPTPAERYNLVVLGAGTAGLVAAAGAAGLGARVALVERGLMGGDCLNTGCVPSKSLLASAREGADFAAAMERMRRVRAELAEHDSAARFRDLGVDVFLGEGHFTAADAIEVEGARLRFARAVIATGATPAIPPVPGLVDAGFQTTETVFDLNELPARMAVVGGGPLGCELAQAFARLGSSVVLVELASRLLGEEDEDAAEVVRAALARDGVELALGARLTAVGRTRRGRRLQLEGPGGTAAVEADTILVAVGRRPHVAGLGLGAAGVALDADGRLRTDDRLRTTNHRIYAAGDVVGGSQFTHLADAHARIVIRNALFPGSSKASALTIPHCTYTDPEVARVGHSFASAAKARVRARSFLQPFDSVDRPRLEGEFGGFARVLVREGGDEIVGATIVGRHAGESISLVTLAIQEGIGLADLAAVVHPYPTRAQALGAVADRYQRARLGSRSRSFLDRWMRWRRR